MKKTTAVYFFMIVAIAIVALLFNLQIHSLANFDFGFGIHKTIETIITLLLLSVFIQGNRLFSKTGDNRYLILAGGFLLGAIFSSVHIFTIHTFPYDNLAFSNIEKKPTLFYLLLGNLIIPFSIYFSILYKDSMLYSKIDFKRKVYDYCFYIFSGFTIASLAIYKLFPWTLHHFYILIHSLEFVNYAIYLMLAAIIINSSNHGKKFAPDLFTLGLLLLGFGGLFYINPDFLPAYGMLAHILAAIGISLILMGLPNLSELANSIRVKDEFVSYLSLILIAFYVVFVPIASGVYNLIFPQYSGYLFVEFLLVFQFIIYIYSETSYNKVAGVYITGERNKTLVRVFESMERVSNSSIIKDAIINEIKKDLVPDKCFIALFAPSDKSFYLDKYIEKLPSKMFESNIELEEFAIAFKRFNDGFNNNISMNFEQAENYISKNSLKGSVMEKLLLEQGIKSYYSLPINYKDKFFGYLILIYSSKYKALNQDDFAYLKKLAELVGTAINNENNN